MYCARYAKITLPLEKHLKCNRKFWVILFKLLLRCGKIIITDTGLVDRHAFTKKPLFWESFWVNKELKNK